MRTRLVLCVFALFFPVKLKVDSHGRLLNFSLPIMFYIVSEDVHSAVVSVGVVDGTSVKKHFPVRMLVRGDAQDALVPKIRAPPKWPAIPVYGPANLPVSIDLGLSRMRSLT